MIPSYEQCMRPVLECARNGEVHVKDMRKYVAEYFKFTDEQLRIRIPSGKQPLYANRAHWAKTYLVKAGLLEATRRGYFTITERGKEVLATPGIELNSKYLNNFEEFVEFYDRPNGTTEQNQGVEIVAESTSLTPEEELRMAYERVRNSLQNDILQRVRKVDPSFFEQIIVDLLLAMGYGGATENAGRTLGRTGDNGVDGVIDQDPLGVDQVYLQAKRYDQGNTIGPGAIRDFFGSLNLHKAQKGIFITTSDFTASAKDTAANLGTRIVLINGNELANLMYKYNVGCRTEEELHLKDIDEEYFEGGG